MNRVFGDSMGYFVNAFSKWVNLLEYLGIRIPCFFYTVSFSVEYLSIREAYFVYSIEHLSTVMACFIKTSSLSICI